MRDHFFSSEQLFDAFADGISFIAMQVQKSAIPPIYDQYVVIMRIKHRLYLHEGSNLASLYDQVRPGVIIATFFSLHDGSKFANNEM